MRVLLISRGKKKGKKTLQVLQAKLYSDKDRCSLSQLCRVLAGKYQDPILITDGRGVNGCRLEVWVAGHLIGVATIRIRHRFECEFTRDYKHDA
jgi:Cft2 family RNA processing exonuclease